MNNNCISDEEQAAKKARGAGGWRATSSNPWQFSHPAHGSSIVFKHTAGLFDVGQSDAPKSKIGKWIAMRDTESARSYSRRYFNTKSQATRHVEKHW